MSEEIKVGSEVTIRVSSYPKDSMKITISDETDELWISVVDGFKWTFNKKTLKGDNNAW